MVVSILEAGRVTLYAMEDWIRNLPVQDYWGEQVLSNHFTDDRLADTLDVVWDIGLDSTFTRIMGHSMVRYGLTAERLHSDGSTIAVQGAYDLPDDTVGPIPLRGFSKDNKRDCKQLVVGATVQQDGIPLAFSFYDGNTTDQPIYREHMERIADAMRGSKNTTFIADCKLCDRYCLGALYAQGMHTITLLPRSHANHASTLDAALNLPIDQWHIIEQRPSRSSDEPTIFRGVVVPIDMQLSVPNGVDSEGQHLFESKTVQWSALVVHSSQLAQNHEAELQSKWDKASATAEKQARAVSKLQFETQSAAQEALTLFIKDTRCTGSTVHGKVVEELIRTPRRRGRPRVDLPPSTIPTKQAWRIEISIEPDENARTEALKTAGTFVLVSSKQFGETLTQADALHQYREQFQVETAFRWLKQPGLVAPILLHTPKRIAALGFVFAVALAVYRIIQHRVRTGLAREGKTIPGNNHQPTSSPTTAVIAKLFHDVHRIIIASPQGTMVWLKGLTPAHKLVLSLLGLPDDLGLSDKLCQVL